MPDVYQYYARIGKAVELPIGARFIREYFEPDHHSRDELIARNGKWGTCSGCPRDARDGKVHPEFCIYYNRYDHNIMETGQVFEYVMDYVPTLG